jgi:hypothetical protein
MKSVLIVHNYFGPRRISFGPYEEDPLFLAKKQIQYLEEVKHNLDHVVLTVNSRGLEDNENISKLLSILPEKLQKASTEILIRENVGLSYGAFSDVYTKYRRNYDYYFFTEDDYLFCEDFFDTTLILMLMENENPGFLCAATRDMQPFGKHAGNSTGVLTSKSLEAVFMDEGCIPHVREFQTDKYENVEIPSQVLHSTSITKRGFSLTDIGKIYTLYHAWESGYERFFENNTREIITPLQRII